MEIRIALGFMELFYDSLHNLRGNDIQRLQMVWSYVWFRAINKHYSDSYL